jgi:hypothetical protein
MRRTPRMDAWINRTVVEKAALGTPVTFIGMK